MKEKILVVAAHPDDEVLGCGATIKRFTKEGKDVYIAILGEGITSRYKKREDADTRSVNELKKKSQKVANYLGVKSLFSFDLPDNRFDTFGLLDIVKIIEGAIERVHPATIFTHHGSDLNIDHVITHRAVMTAARPASGCPVKDILLFEVASSTEWSFGQFKPVFNPNVFYEISKELDVKINAMKLYDTELREFPHPRSRETIIACARRWASVSGLKAAEAFVLLRSIR